MLEQALSCLPLNTALNDFMNVARRHVSDTVSLASVLLPIGCFPAFLQKTMIGLCLVSVFTQELKLVFVMVKERC